MKKLLTVCCALALITAVGAEDAKKEKEFKAPCPVSGGPAKEESCLEYKGGKVYFCCNNCPKAFAKDPKKFATKANLQLVSTGQAKQEKCPISGGRVNPEKTVKVGDVTVAFCCGNCQKKAQDASGDDQLTLLFSDEAFEKGFKVPEKKKAE